MKLTPNQLPCSYDQNHKKILHKVNSRLIRNNNGKIYQFKNLPIEAQLALAHYMGIDGEAWDFAEWGVYEDGLRERDVGLTQTQFHELWEHNAKQLVQNLAKALPQIVERYGKLEYGLVNIPTQQLKDAWLEINDDAVKDYKTFDAYHQWYQGGNNHYVKTPTWPVILGSFHFELLEDGWHRFHGYIANNAYEIPALWYPHKTNQKEIKWTTTT